MAWQSTTWCAMSTARAALLLCFEPVFATITSWLWLGERLSITQWIGGALILGGMILAELPHGPAREKSAL